MLRDPTFADVVFILEKGAFEIRAHKCIIASRCEVFKSMLTSSMKESRENRIEIPDTKYEVFNSLLEYLYTDEI